MALPDSDAFRVFVRRNDLSAQQQQQQQQQDAPVPLMVSQNQPFKRFLQDGGSKLGIKANRCYKMEVSGALQEITFMDVLHVDDVVILTESAITGPGPQTAAAPAAQFPAALGSTSNMSAASVGTAGSGPSAQPREEVNIAIVGAGGAGKSSLTVRYMQDMFPQYWNPTVEDAFTKQTTQPDGSEVQVRVLDTAGQEEFGSMRFSWLVDKDAFVFVYSIDSDASLEALDAYVALKSNFPDTPVVVLANKKDLVDENPKLRRVTAEEGMRKAALVGARFYEASALTGENVELAFDEMVACVRARRRKALTDQASKAHPMRCAPCVIQ